MRARLAHGFAALTLALLAGCATTAPPPRAPSAAAGGPIPSKPIALGDYARGDIGAVGRNFSAEISQRYARGAALGKVTADLAKNKFVCLAPTGAGGDPPDHACKRVLRAGGCTATYRVNLYDDDSNRTLDRVRGLFDRTCAGELLGG